MALALTAYEASLCGGCGLSYSKTHGEHNHGRYMADTDDICYGCEPLETLREDTNRATYPGQKVSLVENPDFVPDGTVLGSG